MTYDRGKLKQPSHQ